MLEQLPTVVIVGRPNVGKSTLFNRITGERRSIVGDEPGITRDRIYGIGENRGRRFEVVDTGGIVVNDEDYIPAEILRQARVALDTASQVILLVDGRSEITGSDRDLAQMLLRLGKPVTLAVNKADSGARESLAHEFYSLGIRDVFPVSAEHGIGVAEMLDHLTAAFPKSEAPEKVPKIKVAIIGRPNVGKSTLLNALTGLDRAIVSPIAGTTRDSVDETVIRNGVEYVFVDTAGIRRKGKTNLMAEKLSVVMARRSIRMAHVVLLVLDAEEGVLNLDATIAGYAHEGGRGVLIVVNKWDLIGEAVKRKFEADLRDELKFLEYAPVVFISAKTGENVTSLFKLIRKAHESASMRISTGELNRFVQALEFAERKILYATQASIRPPTFVLFTDKSTPLHFSDERYISNQIRKRFGLEGTPIVVRTRARNAPRERSRGKRPLKPSRRS
jgi:GTP-binding protein